MNDIKIIKNNNYKESNISKQLHSILNKELLKNNLFLSFSYRNNDNIEILYNNHDEYLLFYDNNIENGYLKFIELFIEKKNIDIESSYNLIDIGYNLNQNNDYLFKLFKLVKWHNGKKGLDYFFSMKNFSKLLKNKIFNNKISINEAYFFHNYFIKDYDQLIEKIGDNLSFSEANEVIRNIFEYSKKYNKTIKDILTIIESGNDNIIEFARKLRYPYFYKFKTYFLDFINNFNLPKNCKIIFDQYFEKDDYTLEIKFQNFKQLREKVNKINNNLNKLNIDENNDFFIISNIDKIINKDE